MGTSTITHTEKDPNNNAVPSYVTNFRLTTAAGQNSGFRLSDGTGISSLYSVTASTAGAISVALENNSNITPGGSFYVAELLLPSSAGGTREEAIISSSSTSPQSLYNALLTAVPSYVPPTTVSPTVLSGNNTFTGVNQFNGNVYFKSGYPWVDVKAYGAAGDNSTDDTTAINNAVTDLADGGTLYFPPGTYLVSGSNTITITKRIRIEGAGAASILRKTGTGDLLVLGAGTVGNQKDKLYVGNLTLASEAGAGDALKLRAIHRSLFENVNIPSAAGAGVRLVGSLLNTFVSLKVSTNLTYTVGTGVHPTHGVSLESGETGTGVGGSNSNTFIGPEFAGITTSPGIGFNINNGDGNLLAGGATEGNTEGLTLGVGVHNNVVIGTDFEANGDNVAGTRGDNMFLNTPNVTTYLGSNAQVADGTAGVPSVQFLNDTDTGLFRHGTNETGFTAGGAEIITVSTSGLTVNNGENIIFGISTGSKIGTSASQKMGFWNVTPVAQQVLATGAAHTVDDVITLLQTIGLCKQS